MTGILLAAALLLPSADYQKHLYPRGTNQVVQFDLAAARESELITRQIQDGFQRLVESNEQVRKLTKLLEVDLAKDIKGITLCTSGGGPGNESFLMILDAKLPYEPLTKELERMAEDGELTSLSILDLPIYFDHRARQAVFFGVIDHQTVIASPSKAWVEDAVQGLADLRDPPKNLEEKLAWAAEDELGEDGLPQRPTLVLAGKFPEEAKRNMARNPQFAAIAGDLVGYNARVILDPQPRIYVRFEMTDAEAAEQAVGVLDFLLDLGRTTLANNDQRPDIQEFLEGLELDDQDEYVVVTSKMSRELLQQIIANNETDREERQRRFRERIRERREREAAERAAEEAN